VEDHDPSQASGANDDPSQATKKSRFERNDAGETSNEKTHSPLKSSVGLGNLSVSVAGEGALDGKENPFRVAAEHAILALLLHLSAELPELDEDTPKAQGMTARPSTMMRSHDMVRLPISVVQKAVELADRTHIELFSGESADGVDETEAIERRHAAAWKVSGLSPSWLPSPRSIDLVRLIRTLVDFAPSSLGRAASGPVI